MMQRGFNTSHITINLEDMFKDLEGKSFNTSHITINPTNGGSQMYKVNVSIHPILLLIKQNKRKKNKQKGFNTSHITINLFNSKVPQYIF